MTSSYARNVPHMTRRELVGLAKNRFTDHDTQKAIAKSGYRLAVDYLSTNPNISDECVDLLWERRGYILKCNLIASGRKVVAISEWSRLYKTHFKRRMARPPWSMSKTFLNCEANVPIEVLRDIKEDLLHVSGGRHRYNLQWSFRSLAGCKNTDLALLTELNNYRLKAGWSGYLNSSFEGIYYEKLLQLSSNA